MNDIEFICKQIVERFDNPHQNIDDCVDHFCVGYSPEFINSVWQCLEEEYGIY